MSFQTPILFIIFNRPDTTRVVFEEIRKLKPARLFIAGDGPREDRPGEKELVDEARKIATSIDWPCEVKTLFQEKNLGCKYAPSQAITWFFDQVEEGIIIEDDCVPHPDFWRFCEELLAKYRTDERVMMITGDNFQAGNSHFRPQESYYFSGIPSIWGWASWKRAWKHYDLEMKDWPETKKSGSIKNIFKSLSYYEYWEYVFDTYYEGRQITWDTPWAYRIIKMRGLTIAPIVNLISNIGFREDATHTKAMSPLANLPVAPLRFPLTHPSKFQPYQKADGFHYRTNLGVDARFFHRLIKPFKRSYPNAYRRIKRLLGR